MPKYKHFTDAIPDIKFLRSEGNCEELESLLLWCLEATEKESKRTSTGVAPFYYEEMAKLYRKTKRNEDEVAVLERFASQKHAPGAKPAKLLERLSKIQP